MEKETPTYVGPGIIGNQNDLPEPKPRTIYVKDKETNRIIHIKADRFNPEIHEGMKEGMPGKKTVEPVKPVAKMAEIRAKAKELKIKVPFGCKKDDLIKLIDETISQESS